MTSHTKSFMANKTYSPHVIFILLAFNYRLHGTILAIMFWLPLIDLFRKLNLVRLSFDFSSLAFLVFFLSFIFSLSRSLLTRCTYCNPWFLSYALLFFIGNVISFGYVCYAFCHKRNNILFLFCFHFCTSFTSVWLRVIGIAMWNSSYISISYLTFSLAQCYRCPFTALSISTCKIRRLRKFMKNPYKWPCRVQTHNTSVN